MPLAKRLVARHGRTIALASKLGGGTTATLTFPGERVLEAKPALIAA